MTLSSREEVAIGEYQLNETGGRMRVSLLLVLFFCFCALYLLIANILARIGFGEIGILTMVIVIPVAVFIGTGVATRMSGSGKNGGLRQFQIAGGNIGPLHNAMAGASEWLSLFFIVGLIAVFSTTNHDGLAIIAGVFIGFGLMAIFIIPHLPKSSNHSLAQIITSQISDQGSGNKLLRSILALVMLMCMVLFLIAQIGAGSQIVTLHFDIPIYWAAAGLLIPLLFTILAGGMRALTLANMLLYCVIGAALYLPAIWLSLRITGNPLPQLSFGTGALQPILNLEEQLAQAGSGTAIVQSSDFASSADFMFTMICIMAGTAALPLFYSRLACTNGNASRARATGWTIILVALMVSIIPAFMVFMKFEIFRDLVGLPISQLGNEISWLFNWASLEGGHHALVCGKPALDIPAMVSACGNNPDHLIVPADLQFTPLMILLGAGEIASMPTIFTAITYAGVISISLTTAGIALMTIINILDKDFIFALRTANTTSPEFSKKTDIELPDNIFISQATAARRLFVSRILIIGVAVFGIWLSRSVAVPVTDFTLWAFTLIAGSIFPIWILAIFWKPTTSVGALSGLILGFVSTAFLLLTIEYGPDWIAVNGDEPRWIIPFTNQPLKAMNAGIVGLPIAILTSITVSFVHRLSASWRQRVPQ